MLTENTIADVEKLVKYLNDRMHDAKEREIDHHILHGRPYAWQSASMSPDEVRATLRSVNPVDVTYKVRSKYVAIDMRGSGQFLVDMTDGGIYGIKAYGVIHRGYYYGTLANPNRKNMLNKLAGMTLYRFVKEGNETTPSMSVYHKDQQNANADAAKEKALGGQDVEEESGIKRFSQFRESEKCYYCSTEPISTKHDPYCSAECAINAEND